MTTGLADFALLVIIGTKVRVLHQKHRPPILKPKEEGETKEGDWDFENKIWGHVVRKDYALWEEAGIASTHVEKQICWWGVDDLLDDSTARCLDVLNVDDCLRI